MSDPITWTNVTVKLSQLHPWEGNPKTSTAKNVKQLQTSRDELGQFQTVAIGPPNGNGLCPVYDGHQRLSAWQIKYGPNSEIDARQSSRPLTDEERRKVAIYSRQIGAWDWDTLSNWDASELTAWGFDTDLLGDWRRDVAALGNFIEANEELEESQDAEAQTNRADELREEWGVELGQMWRLPSRTEGQEHRLICGDCTDAAVVDRVMGGEKADMVLNDPPYGMRLDTDYTAIMGRGNKYDPVIGDDEDWDYSKTDFFDCDEQFYWGADYYRNTLPRGGSWFVWDKQISDHDGLSHTGSLFELCWSKVEHKREIIKVPYFRFYGMDTKTRLHPTQKPERLYAWFINKFSTEKSKIVDLFSGSGTTIIAAENLSRQCRAVEISPNYVSVALERYKMAFGITAELVE